MTNSEWNGGLGGYPLQVPFDGGPKAIKIEEGDVDEELLISCVENHIVSEVAKGYFITHQDIEEHQEVINEHGMEAYLRKRLEVLDDN